MKRIFDFLLSLFTLLVLLIPMLVISSAIKFTSSGPVLYWSKRVGKNNEIFKMPKFRTMCTDTPAVATHLLGNPDRYVTGLGKILRKTSLDELPQFWNVLRGDMSLVGTRPPTPDEVAHYENWHRRRISIKPGITGLWQISGRNQIQEFDDIVRLDLEYIDKWNIWLDIRILIKTVKVVFVREGSC